MSNPRDQVPHPHNPFTGMNPNMNHAAANLPGNNFGAQPPQPSPAAPNAQIQFGAAQQPHMSNVMAPYGPVAQQFAQSNMNHPQSAQHMNNAPAPQGPVAQQFAQPNLTYSPKAQQQPHMSNALAPHGPVAPQFAQSNMTNSQGAQQPYIFTGAQQPHAAASGRGSGRNAPQQQQKRPNPFEAPQGTLMLPSAQARHDDPNVPVSASVEGFNKVALASPRPNSAYGPVDEWTKISDNKFQLSSVHPDKIVKAVDRWLTPSKRQKRLYGEKMQMHFLVTIESFPPWHSKIPINPALWPKNPAYGPPRQKTITGSKPCAKCRRPDHFLNMCIGPPTSMHGDIYGCPNCNTTDHCFDECHLVRGTNGVPPMSEEQKYIILVHNRQNKPQIRTDHVFSAETIQMFVAKHKTQSLPWIRPFAIKQRDLFDFDSYDYETGLPQLPHDEQSDQEFYKDTEQSFRLWKVTLSRTQNARMAQFAPPAAAVSHGQPPRPPPFGIYPMVDRDLPLYLAANEDPSLPLEKYKTKSLRYREFAPSRSLAQIIKDDPRPQENILLKPDRHGLAVPKLRQLE